MALRVRFSRYTLIMNRALRFYLILFEKRWRSKFKMKTEFGKKKLEHIHPIWRFV